MLEESNQRGSVSSYLAGRPLQVAIPLFCASIILLLAYWIYQQQVDRIQSDEQQLFEQRSERIASSIVHATNEHVIRADSLAQVVALNPMLTNEDFAKYVDSMLQSDLGLLCGGLVEGEEIRTTFPSNAPGKLFGLDSSNTSQLSAATRFRLQSGQPVLDGPLDLLQGGRAFVVRVPVMTSAKNVVSESSVNDEARGYWGHVAFFIQLEALVSDLIIDLPADFDVSLQQIDQGGDETELLFGKAIPEEKECMRLPIELPGLTWTLGLVPEAGWTKRLPDHNIRVFAAAVLCAVSAFVAWLFLRLHLLRSEHLEQLQYAQQSMQSAQARLRLALTGGNIGLWDLHTLTGKTVYSENYQSLLGEDDLAVGPDTLDHLKSRLHPDDKETERAFDHFLTGDKVHFQAEFRLRCGDGQYRWFRTEATGSGERGTEDHRVMGVLIDVSEDRESRERLLDERLETQLVLDSIPSLVILQDANDRILRVNEAVARATGRDPESLTGKMVQEVIPSGSEPEVSHEEGIVRSVDLRSNDVRLLGDRWVQTQSVPVRNSRGRTNRTIIVSTDITDLKQAELSQQRANRFQTKVGELARIGGWDFDLVTNKLAWSDMVKQIHEVPDDYQPEIATAINFYRDDARERIQAVIDESIANDTSWDIELPLITAKERQIYVRSMGQPVFENGRCVALWGVFQDVTKLHQENELRETLFRNAPNAYLLFTEDGIVECNLPAIKMLRAETKAKLLQHHPADFSPEVQPCGSLSSEKCKQMDAAALERGVHRFEWLHQRMDGEVFPCEVTLSTVDTDSGPALLAAWRDLSEQKEAERERDSFFALSLDLFCVIDQDGRFKRVNSAWRQLQGQDPDRLPGVSVADLATTDHRASTQQMLQELASVGRITDFRNKVTWNDGTDRWLEWNALAASDNDKVFFAVARDVTERIQSEERLSELNDELTGTNEALQQSNVDLQQFAYVASHDLQTPLRGIAGFAQLLEEDYGDQMDATASNYLNRITSGTQRMQRLIQDLLQYSRIEIQGQQLGPVDLNRVVDDILVLLQTEIEDRNTTLSCDELPTILGDSSQLFQLFTNVIGNAIKYNTSEKPEVNISVVEPTKPQGESDHEWLEITVQDNGIGIEPKFQSQIFEVFRRLHTEREYSGTGIGLAICKRVMQRHEGEIWVTGKPGEGSCFHLRFPAYARES